MYNNKTIVRTKSREEGEEERQEAAEVKEENQDVARAAERIYELHTDEIIKTITKNKKAIREKAKAYEREFEEALFAYESL